MEYEGPNRIIRKQFDRQKRVDTGRHGPGFGHDCRISTSLVRQPPESSQEERQPAAEHPECTEQVQTSIEQIHSRRPASRLRVSRLHPMVRGFPREHRTSEEYLGHLLPPALFSHTPQCWRRGEDRDRREEGHQAIQEETPGPRAPTPSDNGRGTRRLARLNRGLVHRAGIRPEHSRRVKPGMLHGQVTEDEPGVPPRPQGLRLASPLAGRACK